MYLLEVELSCYNIKGNKKGLHDHLLREYIVAL